MERLEEIKGWKEGMKKIWKKDGMEGRTTGEGRRRREESGQSKRESKEKEMKGRMEEQKMTEKGVKE